MNVKPRTVTSATVTITLELSDLGTFELGCLFKQVRHAAANRLGGMLGVKMDPEHFRIDAISTDCGLSYSKIEAIRP